MLGATLLGLVLAWIYSAPPFRLKQDGVLGPAVVAVAYEGVTWFTGAAVMAAALPSAPVLWLAALYSIGAHGIMTLNDFKAVEGDRLMGVRSLPAELGVGPAAQIACAVMAAPQAIVICLLLVAWNKPWFAAAVALSLGIQLVLMNRLMSDPKKLTPWFNATGTALYVLGMLVSAFAVRTISGTGQ